MEYGISVQKGESYNYISKDILAERKSFSLLNLCRQEIRQCLSLARPKKKYTEADPVTI